MIQTKPNNPLDPTALSLRVFPMITAPAFLVSPELALGRRAVDQRGRWAALHAMTLETGSSPVVKHPTEQDLRDAFKNDEGRGEFIILSQRPEVYMQAGGEVQPFSLEYRDGDAERHYRAEGVFKKEDVERAFVWYLTGDSRWKSEFRRRKVDLNSWWRYW